MRLTPEQIAEIREKANYDSGWAERLGVFALLSDREELEAERADQDKLLKSMAVRNDEDAARIAELERGLAEDGKPDARIVMGFQAGEAHAKERIAELERELAGARIELEDFDRIESEVGISTGCLDATDSFEWALRRIKGLEAKAQAYEKVLREYRRLYLEDADMHAATPAKLALDTKALLPEQPQGSEFSDEALAEIEKAEKGPFLSDEEVRGAKPQESEE